MKFAFLIWPIVIITHLEVRLWPNILFTLWGNFSAGLSMWQEWQMPRASGFRGASGSRKNFQDLEYPKNKDVVYVAMHAKTR